MEFGLLGPLEVHDGDRKLRLGGTKQRALVADLLINANQVVSVVRLIDDLWVSPNTMTTDGPFAEAKEQLAGFFLIECETIERAIERAAQVPEAAFGLVEVRPVMALGDFER